MMPAGDLGVSVGTFVVCACTSLGLLAWRRKEYGAELGGAELNLRVALRPDGVRRGGEAEGARDDEETGARPHAAGRDPLARASLTLQSKQCVWGETHRRLGNLQRG